MSERLERKRLACKAVRGVKRSLFGNSKQLALFRVEATLMQAGTLALQSVGESLRD